MASYGSVAGEIGDETVRPAATAVEVLRAHCRLRSECLLRGYDTNPDMPDRESTASLLAGDSLLSLAYGTLGDLDHPTLDACYRILTNTSAEIIETVYSTSEESATPIDDPTLVYGTAGRLGQGAALIGATLARAGQVNCRHVGAFGRCVSTVREIRLSRADETDELMVPISDTGHIRQHANRQLRRAGEALESLEPFIEEDRLRQFFDAVVDDR